VGIRVVIAGDFPDDPHQIIGGIQATVLMTLHGLAEYPDLDLHVVTCEKGGKASRSGPWEAPDPGWLAHYLPSPRKLPLSISFWSADRWEVGRAIRRLAPDLVHAHGQVAAYPWAAFDSGLPHVVTVHGLNSLEARLDPRGGALRGRLRSWLWSQVEMACLRRATDIVIISPFVENFVRPHTRARLHPIENPVEASLFQVDRSQAVPGRILYVGSIQKRKGLTDLIQAIHLLKDQHPQIHLHVVGAFMEAYADYGAQVRAQIRLLNLEDKVYLCEQLDRIQLRKEFSKCEVFCLPSYLEASPVVVAEAMAAGCPIITTTIESTAHLILDGKNGFRCPPGDAHALAGRLHQLMQSPDLRVAFGQAARTDALRRFTPQKSAQATRDLYLDRLGVPRASESSL